MKSLFEMFVGKEIPTSYSKKKACCGIEQPTLSEKMVAMSALDHIAEFDRMTAAGYKLNLLTGRYEKN